MKKGPLVSNLLILLSLAIALVGGKPSTASGSFPLYPCVEPNFHFWVDIYTKYPTTKGILHDSRDLNIVYAVLDLCSPDRHGARALNRKRIKAAKEKYKKILEKVARNAAVQDPEATRVADLFGPNAAPGTFRSAMHHIRCQIGQKDRFQEGLARSGAYIDKIKGIFRSHGLPEDLSYLPHVESSFNLKAYSKFGAAGIWQFTRSTAKQFMNVDYALDERRDPIRSAEAAARLLKRNYDKLGSWPLAITAYNHGVAGMLRAKRVKGSYEAIFKSYRSRRFKFASRNFYAEFLAARHIANNHERYFGALGLDKPLETLEVVIAGYASISDLSHHFDVDIETIHALNPALRPPVLKEQKYVPEGYALRLPADRIQASSLESLQSVYQRRQKPSRFYRVKNGDTLSEIAMVHGLKISDLVSANNLDSRGTIYVDQNLRLPVPGEKPAQAEPLLLVASESPYKDATQLAQAEVLEGGSTLFQATIPASELSINPGVVAGNLEVEHVVIERGRQMGIIRVEVEETLGHYAEWLTIPTQKIRRLNGFSYGRPLRLNQKVKIPLDKVSKEQFEEARFQYHQEIQEDFLRAYQIVAVQIYEVKNGDNVWTLCNETFNLPLWLIKKYNPDVDFYDLRRTQKLAVPVVEERV
ncbi:MAG: transglycosylase SLT domain-containing protein, partial [Deltaproteobacteria bacterium]